MTGGFRREEEEEEPGPVGFLNRYASLTSSPEMSSGPNVHELEPRSTWVTHYSGHAPPCGPEVAHGPEAGARCVHLQGLLEMNGFRREEEEEEPGPVGFLDRYASLTGHARPPWLEPFIPGWYASSDSTAAGVPCVWGLVFGSLGYHSGMTRAIRGRSQGRSAFSTGTFLTQCIHQLVSESYLPHKTINLILISDGKQEVDNLMEGGEKRRSLGLSAFSTGTLQGCLAHKKQPPHLGSPYDPRYSPTVGS